MSTNFDLQDQLPLTEATFFILLSMAHIPRHGYAIIKDVEELSQNRITLSTGTLYTALARLLEQGWIERSYNNREDDTGHPRKVYRLSALGRRILAAEDNRLESLVLLARLRMAEG